MSEKKLGDFSPEQLKDARQRAHKEVGEKRAERRESDLEKQMAEYLKPFTELKNNFEELREKYAGAPSEQEIEKMADSILYVAEKDKSDLEVIAEAFNKKNLYRFMRERTGLGKILEKSEKDLNEMIVRARGILDLTESVNLWDKADEWRNFNQSINEIINKELPNQNPESFMAHSLLTLRDYKKQLKTGIVETPEVKKMKNEATDKLFRQGLIALTGETGTGKTKLALKIAQELTGDYEFILGHAMMTKEELLGYLGISPQSIKSEDVPSLIREAKERYEKLNPDEDEAQKNIAFDSIEEVIKRQAAQKPLETKIILGPLFKAAREGKIVIIDEFNYIDPGLLAASNALIEANPGDRITMMGEEVEVKSGFAVILTGNISKAEAKRYGGGRKELDPAFINRLNSGLIEYPTLPQELDLMRKGAIIEQKELKNGQEPFKRDLFSIGLAHIADNKGNLKTAPDSLDQLWKLSQQFSILQKLYSGEEIREMTSDSDTRFNLQKYHASMRTYGEIVQQWKKDAFKYPLEWYLYDNLIRPCSVVAPSESAQMFYILKENGQFFQDEKWGCLNADSRNWKLTGLEKIRSADKEDFRLQVDLDYCSPQDLAESMMGTKMPEMEITTRQEETTQENQERMNIQMEFEKKISEGENFFNKWKEKIEFFCQEVEEEK